MSDATDLVDRQIAAYRARDLEAFLSFYAPDVKIRDFDGNVMMDGQDGMQAMYGALFRDSPDLRLDTPSRMVAGDYVIDEEDLTGFVAAGFPTTMHAVVIYQVRDGLIRHVQLLS